MNIDKYTVKTQEAVKGAIDLAVRKGNQFVTPLHLLGTILDLNDPTFENLITESGGNLPVLKSASLRSWTSCRPYRAKTCRVRCRRN